MCCYFRPEQSASLQNPHQASSPASHTKILCQALSAVFMFRFPSKGGIYKKHQQLQDIPAGVNELVELPFCSNPRLDNGTVSEAFISCKLENCAGRRDSSKTPED